MLGFLRRHEQNKGLSGGQYYEYELDLDPEIVLATRTEIAEHAECKHTKCTLCVSVPGVRGRKHTKRTLSLRPLANTGR